MVNAGGSPEESGESGAASCATRAAPLESNIRIAPMETARRVIFPAIHQVVLSNGTPGTEIAHKPSQRSSTGRSRMSVYCAAGYSIVKTRGWETGWREKEDSPEPPEAVLNPPG